MSCSATRGHNLFRVQVSPTVPCLSELCTVLSVACVVCATACCQSFEYEYNVKHSKKTAAVLEQTALGR